MPDPPFAGLPRYRLNVAKIMNKTNSNKTVDPQSNTGAISLQGRICLLLLGQRTR